MLTPDSNPNTASIKIPTFAGGLFSFQTITMTAHTVMGIAQSIYVSATTYLSQLVWGGDAPLISSPVIDQELQLPETQLQVLPLAVNQESTPQPQQQISIEINEQPTNTESTNSVNKSVPWAKILMAFCFTAALEIDLEYEQIDQRSKPNLKFYLRSVCVTLIFVSLIVSQLISRRFPVASRMLEKVAIILGVTAIFIIIAFPLMTTSQLNHAT